MDEISECIKNPLILHLILFNRIRIFIGNLHQSVENTSAIVAQQRTKRLNGNSNK